MYLTLEKIVKVFPPRGGSTEVTAVNGASIAIEKGELVTLLGPSGCGKTTTLRLIAGFEFPTAGSIHLDGQEINVLPPHKREMSMVFQSYAIFPHLNVYENIAYGLNVKRVPGAEIKERVAGVMELVQLTGLEARAPNQLSGGQQQRVALARALVMEPKVLLMDEPLSNLDAKLREQMRTEIRHIQQRLGITSVYVTHDQIEAMTLSDRVVIMNQGIIEQIGPPMEVYRRPRTRFVADFIGRANFVDGRVAGRDPSVLHVNALGANFHLTNVTEFPPMGTPVTMIVRPEMIRVRKSGGQLRGIVRRAAYLGDRIDYDVAVRCGDVEVNGQTLTAVETDPSHLELHPEGSAVELSFSEDCIHILPEAPGSVV